MPFPPVAPPDTLVPLAVDLDPGYYGLVFGAGLFGSPSGIEAEATASGIDYVGGPAYFFWLAERGVGRWQGVAGDSLGRFVIEGQPIGIPEPATAALFGFTACMGAIGAATRKARLSKGRPDWGALWTGGNRRKRLSY